MSLIHTMDQWHGRADIQYTENAQTPPQDTSSDPSPIFESIFQSHYPRHTKICSFAINSDLAVMPPPGTAMTSIPSLSVEFVRRSTANWAYHYRPRRWVR